MFDQRLIFYTIFQNNIYEIFCPLYVFTISFIRSQNFEKTNSFIFSRNTTFRKSTVFSRHYNNFFRDNKVTIQTPLNITHKRYPNVCLQSLCKFGNLGPSKTTLKELKQRGIVSVQTIPFSYDYGSVNSPNKV